MAMGLTDFPEDLLALILRTLDPIGLISTSQTCRKLRILISPRKRHFAERLLALESHGEFIAPPECGLYPSFYQNPIGIAWPVTSDMTWACTDCLRLLPHIEFDNHSLFGLHYVRIHPSFLKKACTSWEPSRIQEARFYQGWLQTQLAKKRFIRRCIECQFQRGLLAPRFARNSAWGGHRKSIWGPVVRSRQIWFQTSVERWFPQFWEVLASKRPAIDVPLFRIHRQGRCTTAPWAMHMARCPGCSKWQEMRAFRVAGVFEHWTPRADFYDAGTLEYVNWEKAVCTSEVYRNLQCNHCFAEQHGDEALSKVLIKGLRINFHWQRRHVLSKLGSGWSVLRQKLVWMPAEHKPWKVSIKELLKDSDTKFSHPRFLEEGSRLDAADKALLRFRFAQWQDLLQKMNDCGVTDKIFNASDLDDLTEWRDYYDIYEQHLDWFQACEDELDVRPEALAGWALNREGASLM